MFLAGRCFYEVVLVGSMLFFCRVVLIGDWSMLLYVRLERAGRTGGGFETNESEKLGGAIVLMCITRYNSKTFI